jgi:hypothetical protein
MTVDKDFKRLVRERMAKTGESYTAARAQLRVAALVGESAPRGRTADTAALARAFAAAGVRNPATGAAPSEALVFGIGGGIGMAYFSFEYKIGPGQTWITLYLGGRINPFVQRAARGARKDAEFSDVTCARLGVPFSITQTSSARTAEKQLREAVAAGRQVLAVVDEVLLPHGLPRYLAGGFPYLVGVTVEDGEPVMVALDSRAQRTTWAELARLRASIRSAKHRMIAVDRASEPLDLAAAARAGIAETCRGLLSPPMKNFGLPGIAKWADLVGDARDPKGWPKLFRDGRRLAQALKWVGHWVVGPGSDGSFLRALYADFLDEAAELLRLPRLRAVGEQYRALGRAWAALAAAVLPRSIPQLEPIADLLAFKRCLLERHGAGAADAAAELAEIDTELGALDAALDQSPLSDADGAHLREELRARVLRLHEDEEKAARALAAAAG